MEIRLTPEREAQLADLARQQGREPAAIADEALAAYLDHESWLADAVEEGRVAARRGDFVEHEEIGRMIEDRYRAG
jgi:predicted transcriptional regulator